MGHMQIMGCWVCVICVDHGMHIGYGVYTNSILLGYGVHAQGCASGYGVCMYVGAGVGWVGWYGGGGPPLGGSSRRGGCQPA